MSQLVSGTQNSSFIHMGRDIEKLKSKRNHIIPFNPDSVLRKTKRLIDNFVEIVWDININRKDIAPDPPVRPKQLFKI